MSNTKSTYEVIRPIGWLGSRFERGSKVELTESEASAFSSDEIILSEPSAAPVTTGDKVDAQADVSPKKTRKARKK